MQRGQVMIILAMAFIGLAAFIGLTVDAGILFIQIGHLRRAVDSASLAAAGQFREGRPLNEIEAAAKEFIDLNSVTSGTAEIFICDIADPTTTNVNPYHDVTLCPPDENGDGIYNDSPFRKYVRVNGQLPVNFSFLPIIGFDSTTIKATAVSETASVDIVLVMDTSPSMTYDAACDDGDDDDGDGVDDDCDSGGAVAQVGATPDDYYKEPDNCNPTDDCHPFEEVRAAALALVGRMYFPYDRMAVVSFDRNAVAQLHLSDNISSVVSSIDALTVYKFPGCPGAPDPSLCTATNVADGLLIGGNEFGAYLREEAVLILILLSDGSANAATDSFGLPICPGPLGAGNPTWVYPLCRDAVFEIADGSVDPPDTEDMAVRQGYFVGCPEANSFDPAYTSCTNPGQGAVIFTIGLGDQMINNDKCDTAHYSPAECAANEHQGEDLLRFIAAIGDDGDPSTDPCSGVPIGQSCGNYYFAPTGSGLIKVFEAIASRIFTRITQ